MATAVAGGVSLRRATYQIKTVSSAKPHKTETTVAVVSEKRSTGTRKLSAITSFATNVAPASYPGGLDIFARRPLGHVEAKRIGECIRERDGDDSGRNG